VVNKYKNINYFAAHGAPLPRLLVFVSRVAARRLSGWTVGADGLY
jgi:hypothetical protein